jgi:hypothetical protein
MSALGCADKGIEPVASNSPTMPARRNASLASVSEQRQRSPRDAVASVSDNATERGRPTPHLRMVLRMQIAAEGRCGTGRFGLQSLSALIEFYHALRNEATLSCLAGGDAQN